MLVRSAQPTNIASACCANALFGKAKFPAKIVKTRVNPVAMIVFEFFILKYRLQLPIKGFLYFNGIDAVKVKLCMKVL